MQIFKKISMLYLAGLLAGCSTVVFPEIEDNDYGFAQTESEKDQKVIKEGETLGSDDQNKAYEGDENTVSIADNNPEGYKDVHVQTNDPKLNKLLETGEPGVEQKADNVSFKDSSYEEPKAAEPEQPRILSVHYLADTFYFDNGSDYLSPEYNSRIRKVAKLAKERNAVVNVYGYSSSRTGNTDLASHKLANFEVSQKRADSVAKALKRAGIKSKDMNIEALSDTNPAFLEVMPEGERLNRRVEVYISY